MLKLERLGFGEPQRKQCEGLQDEKLRPARVASVDGQSVTLMGLAEDDLGKARRVTLPTGVARQLTDLTVGDWLLCDLEDDVLRWAICLQRTSLFVRKEAGRASRAQPVAANVDRVLIVTSVGADLSKRRLERYLAAVWSAGAVPVVVVNKADQPHDRSLLETELAEVAQGVELRFVSAREDLTLAALTTDLVPGSTVALVGSSGVGKSTMVNRLLGEDHARTGEVREHDDTGKHSTTRRELILAPSGVLLIDTPGMRELGLWDAQQGLEAAFSDLSVFARDCRFGDCSHRGEPGCAVQAAIERGELSEERLESHQQLSRELARNERRSDGRANADQKRRWKSVHQSMRERDKLHERLGMKK